jgi:hypothetical protein
LPAAGRQCLHCLVAASCSLQFSNTVKDHALAHVG